VLLILVLYMGNRVHGFYIPSVRRMYTDAKMRPTIPDHLVQQLDSDVDEFRKEDGDTMSFYEIGGYQSKADFIRDAVREKIERHSVEHGIDEPKAKYRG